MLPAFLKKYFWDVDFEALDSKRHRQDILVRILEYGDHEAAHWMQKNFRRKEIEEVLTQRRLSPRSANYWTFIYHIDRSKVRCLQKPYLEMRKHHWPY